MPCALSGRNCWPVLSCQTECQHVWWQEGFCCLPEAEAAWGGSFHCTPSLPLPCAEKDEEEEDNNNDKEQKREREAEE